MSATSRQRDEIILRGLLIERRKPAAIARDLSISRARIGQIMARLGIIRTRPELTVTDPQKVAELLPEWKKANE